MTIETSRLADGFAEGDYSWMADQAPAFINGEQEVDDLTIARLQRKSPAEILSGLNSRGLIRLSERIYAPSLELTHHSDVNFPGWDGADFERFRLAKAEMETDDERIISYQGEIINPDNPNQIKKVVFIAAGGAQEGLVTARGVYQMRYAMEQAQALGLPIVFLNAITSADPLFASEVGQISRQISDTMALGLNLTVPKVTVITGEAASAGAHAAWQIADTTLILDHGALLTVINPEEAIQLLHFAPEISAEVNRRFAQKLKSQTSELTDSQLGYFTTFIQGAEALEAVLDGKESILENEDQLRAIVRLTKAVSSKSNSDVMLIMPADNPRYVESMLSREADVVTIHADDWQKRAEKDVTLTKSDLISQVKEALQEAQKRKSRDETPIYFRLQTDNFSGFWTLNDVKQILRELHSLGLIGIRFTEAATAGELSQLTIAMREVEEEVNLSSGTFKICLSVETDEAIDQLNQVIQEGDSDKRVTTVVMGVRDYTKSKANKGVKDRDWTHVLVEEAKKRLTAQIIQLRTSGWNDLSIIHAVVSVTNDYTSIHREAIAAQKLGADGMLAISPEQIPHVQTALEGIFTADGTINKERLNNIFQAFTAYFDHLQSGKDSQQLIYEYKRIVYQVFSEYRLKLLQAGGAFPKELQELGIVDGIISPISNGDYDQRLIRSLWHAIEYEERMEGNELRARRLMKLVQLGAKTVRRVTAIDREKRRRKAEGRGQRAAQFWVDLLTNRAGYTEEILTDLEPDTTSDVLAKMGRRGSRSYSGQVKEAQERTGTLAGIIAGYVKIADRNVLLIVRDHDFINATAGASTGEFVRRACSDAVRRKQSEQMHDIAICYIDVSAGGRVQEGALALAPSELAVAGLVQAREAGIPVINVGHTYILGSDGIGPFYQADKIVLVGQDTELGLAGRRIVERTSLIGKNEFPPGFRLAPYHLAVGNIDTMLDRPEELLPSLKEIFASLLIE